jgi:peptide/nickel transport system substrate-binding protein
MAKMRQEDRTPVTNDGFKIGRRGLLRGGVALGLASGISGFSSLPLVKKAWSAGTKTLRLRLLADIQNLDPAFEPQDFDLQTIFNIYENLISFKPGTFDLINTLAESWEASDNGLEFDFQLKQGIPFHKGYGEVTSEDVKFSFERIAGLTTPKIDSPYQKLWRNLTSVEVTGKYTGTIILNEVFAPLARIFHEGWILVGGWARRRTFASVM